MNDFLLCKAEVSPIQVQFSQSNISGKNDIKNCFGRYLLNGVLKNEWKSWLLNKAKYFYFHIEVYLHFSDKNQWFWLENSSIRSFRSKYILCNVASHAAYCKVAKYMKILLVFLTLHFQNTLIKTYCLISWDWIS